MTDKAIHFWESRFQANSTPWERGHINPAFAAWRASGEFSPCRVLVPGAGRSPEPAEMLAEGFDVTALDLAESAVAFQAERLGAERAVLGDVTRWMPDAPFDVIYDQTCLCALPPKLWPAYEAQMRRWLIPGGRLFVLFMQPAMREMFAQWEWPDQLGEGLRHGLGTVEQPAILRRR